MDIANYGINSSAAVSNSTAAGRRPIRLATNAAATSCRPTPTAATGLAPAEAVVSQANYALASYAAQGDYQNAIAGINAQVQQMHWTPPTTSSARRRHVQLEQRDHGRAGEVQDVRRRIEGRSGEYMLRYGYFVQRFVTPPASLECMEKFTFWQMQEAYVRGSLPENTV